MKMSDFADACAAYDKAKAELLGIAPTITPDIVSAIGLDMRTPEQYVKPLTEWLYTQYNIAHHPTVYRNRKRSYQRTCNDGKPQMVFGYESMSRAYNTGFNEYVRTARKIGYHTKKKGLEGVHQLVLHEFAHVLQAQVNGYGYRSIHNESFVKFMRELMILCPFEKNKEY
jgi:hypothetical protein